LSSQAIDIGAESKVHSKLIDNIDSNTDNAAEGLREEALHANEVRKKSEVCSLYVCIAIELIIMIILLVVWLQKK